MTERLQKIAAYIEEGIGFIDVGTDHGYLPAALAENGYAGNIIASDIHESPLKCAVKTAQAAGLEDRIRFVRCDGLSQCEPESIDTIVIAGMGGDLICRILDEAEWCLHERYRLILQPMTKCEILRYWLVNNGFGIESEELAEDGGTIYQIMIARFGGKTRLSNAELFMGKYALCQEKGRYLRLLALTRARMEKALRGLAASGRGEQAAKLALYGGITRELVEMEKEYGDCS